MIEPGALTLRFVRLVLCFEKQSTLSGGRKEDEFECIHDKIRIGPDSFLDCSVISVYGAAHAVVFSLEKSVLKETLKTKKTLATEQHFESKKSHAWSRRCISR